LAWLRKKCWQNRTPITAPTKPPAHPESLGSQLAVIFEGANALTASCNDTEAFTDAQRAASTLLDVTPAGSSH